MAPTFGEVLAKFLVRCEERGLARATVKSYRYFAHSFLEPELGDKVVTDLRISDFEDLYRDMALVHYDASTVKKCATLAGSVLKYAERQEWVTRNVARLAETPKLSITERDIPTPEQLVAFLEEADRDLRDFAWIMANSGMRPGEAVAITQTDLSLDNTLTIRRSLDVSDTPPQLKDTKTGKVRRIALDIETAGLIRARGGPFVLGAERPMRQDLLSKTWKRLIDRLGFTFTPYSMRHFHATQLIAEGHSIKDVADRLGHANSLITEKVYVHFIEARDAALAGSVCGVLGRVRGDVGDAA